MIPFRKLAEDKKQSMDENASEHTPGFSYMIHASHAENTRKLLAKSA
jgi:hypothetical protein